MGALSFLSQEHNGLICINCGETPDKVFIDAVKTKNIAKIKIMTRQEKSSSNYTPGDPDIIMISIAGDRQAIYRKDLTDNYTHLSGNRINVALLKSGKQYLVCAPCNESYKIMKLPSNCIAILPNGKRVSQGSYIIARATETGGVDRETITSLSPAMFRKTFKIPMQSIIKRHIGNKSSNSGELKIFSGHRNNNYHRPTQDRKISNAQGIPNMRAGIGDVKPVNTMKPTSNPINTINTNNKTNYKYRVLAKAVDMNKKLVGFLVQEISTGNTKTLDISTVTKLCMNKSVENVMLVKNQSGTLYLKGNGCSLVTMKEIIV